MASEKPVSLKKHHKSKTPKKRKTKTSSNLTCVLHNTNLSNYGDVLPFTEIRWQKVCETKIVRLSSDNPKMKQIDISSQIPVTLNPTTHGFHSGCYATYTCIPKKRKATEFEAHSPRKKRTGLSTAKSTLFAKKCLFCQGEFKWKGRKKEPLTKCETESAKNSIIEAARLRSDARIIGITEDSCLIAQEAWYHHSCRAIYIRIILREAEKKKKSETRHVEGKQQIQMQEAHNEAFEYIHEYIQREIIDKSNVERVGMIKEKYLSFLQRHYPDSYNQNYKTYKLKNKISAAFGDKIQFWQPNHKSDLIYSSSVPKGSAVEIAFESASSDERMLKEAALLLRRIILDTHKDIPSLPWPPSSDYLLESQKQIPDLLKGFVTSLITTKSKNDLNEQTERRVLSISQDICYNVTQGQWKMPKHLLLGMSIRHITGSKKIVRLLNRLGHCVSHSTLLELETAMCDNVSESSSHLPQGAVRNAKITHWCFDNFDMREETPSGAGTTHSTHGIMLQETDESERCLIQDTEARSNTRSKRRSTTYVPKELPPCYAPSRGEPAFPVKVTDIANDCERQIIKQNFLWMFCRFKLNYNEAVFPGWKGWVSSTSKPTLKTRTILEYLPPINKSINNMETVQEVIEIARAGTCEVGQEWTFITFDMAVAKKAYDIVWNQPEVYKSVIIHVGGFHTMLSYLAALGSFMKASGFEEIVTEAGLCASGSLDQVMKGKHYNRCMRVHTVITEALERLLFESFLQNTGCAVQEQGMKLIASELQVTLTHDKAEEILSASAFEELFANYEAYKQQIRSEAYGKTQQFWLLYMDLVWHLLNFSLAIRTNNIDLYICSLKNLCPLLFSFNHHNYARYLTAYFIQLLNIPSDVKAMLQNNGISVSRSDVPAGRTACDMAMEQTINKDGKSSGGIVGISTNLSAYHRWSVTRHNRAQYLGALYEMTNTESKTNDVHKEMSRTQRRNGEKAVTKAKEAFVAFINPFDGERDALVNLSSGKQLADDVANELLKADESGKESLKEFIDQRLKNKTVDFQAPVKKSKIRTFASEVKKVSTSTSSKKEVVNLKAQRNIFGQLLLLAIKHNIDMEKVLQYPLSPVPWSLGTPDGLPLKTSKSTLLHRIERKDCLEKENVPNDESTYIIDGNALLHSLTEIPKTYSELAERIFSCLPKTSSVHFVTDTYKFDSIKSAERLRRGSSEDNDCVIGENILLPRKWKEFLSSENNKKALINFLMTEWEKDQYASKLKDRQLFFVNEERCYLLTSPDGDGVNTCLVEELYSTQEEADTRIILNCLYASQQSHTTRIVVKSPDTDVFLLLLSHIDAIDKVLIFQTGTGNNRRQINITKMARHMSKPLRDALLGLHSFTGCDTTSCFAGRGKVKALKLLLRDEDLIELFSCFGTTQNVSEGDILKLEAFVCRLYGKTFTKSVDKVRFEQVRETFSSKGNLLSCRSGLDLSKLPPCRNALLLHISRANFQTLIWRRASFQVPDLPSVESSGWSSDGSGVLNIKWHSGSFLPDELSDIIPDDIDNDEVNDSLTERQGDGSDSDSDSDSADISEDSDSDTEWAPYAI